MIGKRHFFSMFTDALKTISCEPCGFQLVIGPPNGEKLEGKKLNKYIKDKKGKHTFGKKYWLKPGESNDFEFLSVDYYRLLDRLIWTVQDLSEEFHIRIINKTGIENPFSIKINHHREDEIVDQMEYLKTDALDEIRIDINSEILPYQGFEILWNIPESACKHNG